MNNFLEQLNKIKEFIPQIQYDNAISLEKKYRNFNKAQAILLNKQLTIVWDNEFYNFCYKTNRFYKLYTEEVPYNVCVTTDCNVKPEYYEVKTIKKYL